jgi:hypothetical protein
MKVRERLEDMYLLLLVVLKDEQQMYELLALTDFAGQSSKYV